MPVIDIICLKVNVLDLKWEFTKAAKELIASVFCFNNFKKSAN